MILLAITTVRSEQVRDATIKRVDLNVSGTTGEVVIAKVIAGTGITISSSGTDAGTGDVTINAAASGITIGTSPVAGGTAGRVLVEAAGVVVSDSANLTWVSPALTIGVAGTVTGQLKLTGSTSGTITISTNNTAGTQTLKIPTLSASSNIAVDTLNNSFTAAQTITTAGGVTSGLYLKSTGTSSSAWTDLTLETNDATQAVIQYTNTTYTPTGLTLANQMIFGTGGAGGMLFYASNASGILLFNTGANNNERLRIGATGELTIGGTGTGGIVGTINFKGSTSGTVTTKVAAAAGTYNWVYPTTSGTTGYLLTSAAGGTMTWTDPSTLGTSGGLTIDTSAITSGGAKRVLFESATNKVSESANFLYDATQGVTLISNGNGSSGVKISANAANQQSHYIDLFNSSAANIGFVGQPNASACNLVFASSLNSLSDPTAAGFSASACFAWHPSSGNYYASGVSAIRNSCYDIWFSTGSTNGGGYQFYTGDGTGSGSTITERLTIDKVGRIGIGQTAPTASLHIQAGSTSASSAPIKLTSGTSMTTAEAGAVEFTTDDLFFTITTGTARKRIAIVDPSGGLTSGRVAFATTNGRLTDDADMTFATDTLTVTKIAATTFTGAPTLSDVNIVLGTTTGTKIGTATSQKLGFWNKTPVIQQTSSITDTTSFIDNGTVDTDSWAGYTIGKLITALKAIGIIA